MKRTESRTKIIATIGPASAPKDVLRKMFLAGVDICRLNFSHGAYDDHLKVIQIIRELNEELDLHISILADLQGPKLRIGEVENNAVQLRNFSKLDWQTNIFAEASAGFGYRALSCLDIHAGYEMLYFCGLALAPDQIDKSSRTDTFHIHNNGYVIVHGVYIGFLFSF